MEGQREYVQRKKQAEEAGTQAMVEEENSLLKNKVAKLIKMRKLAKMALVLDSSTVCVWYVYGMRLICVWYVCGMCVVCV